MYEEIVLELPTTA